MSQENPIPDAEVSLPLSSSDDIEVTINKSTKEISLKDPTTGRLITFKANVIEPEEEENEIGDEDEEDVVPLTAQDFQDALQRIDSLGLTWTADRTLEIKPKNPESEEALYSEEFREIQRKYPALPRELTAVVFHALTGREAPEVIVGDESNLREKVATVRDIIITPEFRSEFFFKHAIKVPYLESVDWEVVVKTRERNVSDIPGTAYALLLLTFHNTNPTVGRLDEHQNTTVAVDINLVNRLIRTFVEIKTALEDSQHVTKLFNELPKIEG